MPDSVTLYCLEAEQLVPADVEAALPLPDLLRGLSPPAPPPELLPGPNGSLAGMQLRIAGVLLRIKVMPASERLLHLGGLQTHLLRRSDLLDPLAPHKVTDARLVLGLVFEPGFDSGGDCESFVRALASRTGALVFRPDGTLRNAAGQLLARPLPPAPAPVEAPAEDEDPQPEPPTPERVAQRALVVIALAWRAALEDGETAGADAQLAAGRSWLEAQGLLTEMEEQEQTLLCAGVGSWSSRDRVDHSWGSEGAAVLGWALGLVELPPHDTQVDPQQVADALGLFAPKPRALAQPTLRAAQQLEWMGSRLLGLHWRLRDFSLQPRQMDFAKFCADNWFGGMDAAGIALADGDLTVGGKPIHLSDARAVRAVESIAFERHRAINWLAGYEPLWSEVDTST